MYKMRPIFVFLIVSTFFYIIEPFQGLTQNTRPEIKISIDGLRDTVIYLAKYYGDKQYLIDTAYRKKSYYLFNSDSLYPQGLYLLAGQGKKHLMDLLMGADQTFQITSDTISLFNHAKIKGNEELEAFFIYFRDLGKKQELKKALNDRYITSINNTDSINIIKQELKQLDSLVKINENQTISRFTDSFLAVFLKASRETELPDHLKKSDTPEMKQEAYQYLRSHYWDNLSFTDARLLNTPFFYQKIDSFLEKMIIPSPDSLITAIDQIINKTGKSGEIFKFLIWKLTTKYQSSTIMGFDKIYVHLIDTYYTTGLVNWYDSKVMEQLIERANTLKPVLIGKSAPPMILADTSGKYFDLYKLTNKFIIIYFWDPDCGHCREELPKIMEFYENYKDSLNLEVYSVCVDSDIEKMKKYLKKNQIPWIITSAFIGKTPNIQKKYDAFSTPLIYIVDENKTIIAKRILSGQFLEFFDRYKKSRN